MSWQWFTTQAIVGAFTSNPVESCQYQSEMLTWVNIVGWWIVTAFWQQLRSTKTMQEPLQWMYTYSAQFYHGWYWYTVDFTSQVFAPGRWLLFVVPAPHVTPLEVCHCPGIIAGLRCSSMASDTSKLTPLFFYCGTTAQSSSGSSLISYFSRLPPEELAYWPPTGSDKHRANKGFWASAVRILGDAAY